MGDFTKVSVNGHDYYVPADSVDYIVESNGYLINVSGSTITLYGSLREYGNNASGYPRITLSSFSKATYQSSNTATISTLQVNSYSVKKRQFNDNYMFSILMILLLVLIFFKRS